MKFLFFLFLFLTLFLPQLSRAQTPAGEEVFEARVIQILEERETKRSPESTIKQQNLLLEGTDGVWKGKQIRQEGIGEVDVVSAQAYRVGDRVLVQKTVGPNGDEQFFIVDFIRRGYLYLLAALFAVIVIVIGKMKGVRALIGLVVSFIVIIEFILPRIVAGDNPLLIGLSGAFAMIVVIIYLTEGWNVKSHLAAASVFLTLSLTLLLSLVFTSLTRLSGLGQEETLFLMGATKQAIDFHGLLLTGMLIGAVGVLDDIVVGQIEAVQQIRDANDRLPVARVFSMAYKIGNTHFSAIVNTLFLTYAGASLPLLLLFTIRQEPFISFSQVINSELIATEIVRTFVGSIGIALSLPIATYLAARWLANKTASAQ